MKKNKLFDEEFELVNDVDEVSVFQEKKEDIVVKVLPPKTRKRIRKGEEKALTAIYDIAAGVCFVFLIGVLLYCVMFLPIFGANKNNITLNEIVTEYIQNGIEVTGATNFVTGMILDYRAFDTLGESFVLFTAVTCVMILLQNFHDNEEIEFEKIKMFNDKILRYSASFLVPVILLLGAYVILNGSISPGGGFSGGAIMGAGLILYSLAFGFKSTSKFFNIKNFKIITSTSLLTYCLCKALSFYTSVNGPMIHPFGIPGAIFSGGFIFILNFCVGLIVACTMFGFYLLFKKGEI